MRKCAICGRVYSDVVPQCPMCGVKFDAVSKVDKNNDYPFSHGIETERDSGFKLVYAGPPVIDVTENTKKAPINVKENGRQNMKIEKKDKWAMLLVWLATALAAFIFYRIGTAAAYIAAIVGVPLLFGAAWGAILGGKKKGLCMVLVGAVLEGMTGVVLFVVATFVRFAPEFDLTIAEALSQISIADLVADRDITRSFLLIVAIAVGEVLVAGLIASAIAGKIRKKKEVGPAVETTVEG